MAITYRITKGSELTYAEMDENFETLEDAIPLKMGGDAFLHIQDQKTQGTSGGTFTSGAWRTRDLNTVLTNTITGASLAANQITLPAGKYYVEASAPAWYTGKHRARIASGITQLILGFSAFNHTVNITNERAIVVGFFSLSEEGGVHLQQICSDTKGNNGFGVESDLETEVYSDIRIWRIGEYVAP